jgi:hypothetical protein
MAKKEEKKEKRPVHWSEKKSKLLQEKKKAK